MDLIKIEDGIKITSNMIAELTGKRHKNVMRDIKTIVENIGVEEIGSDLSSSKYIDNSNREQPNYTMTMDGLMLVITKYSDVHRMKLIKYCRELETKEKNLNTITTKKLLLADLFDSDKMVVVSAHKQLIEIETKPLREKIELDQPKVSFAETIEKANDGIIVRDLSKILGNEGIKIGQNKLFAKLREYGYICKESTMPTQRAIQQELFAVSEIIIKTINGDKIRKTPKVTGKGQIFIVNKIKKELMMC